MTSDAWTPTDPWEPFVYQAQALRVIDGDTIECRIDLGFDIYHIENVRLRTVDTAEIHFVETGSDEYDRGMVHKEFTKQWLADAEAAGGGEWPLVLKTEYDASGLYGRLLADVYARADPDAGTLADALLARFDDVREF